MNKDIIKNHAAENKTPFVKGTRKKGVGRPRKALLKKLSGEVETRRDLGTKELVAKREALQQAWNIDVKGHGAWAENKLHLLLAKGWLEERQCRAASLYAWLRWQVYGRPFLKARLYEEFLARDPGEMIGDDPDLVAEMRIRRHRHWLEEARKILSQDAPQGFMLVEALAVYDEWPQGWQKFFYINKVLPRHVPSDLSSLQKGLDAISDYFEKC